MEKEVEDINKDIVGITEKSKNPSRSKKVLFITIIAIAIVTLLLILAFFIFTSNPVKDVLSESGKSKQKTGENGLNTASPTTSSGSNEIQTSPEDSSGSGTGSAGGSNLESSEEETEESTSAAGKLEIVNKISDEYTNGVYRVIHYPEGIVGVNDLDLRYYAMFDPSGITAKIVSNVDGTELDVDSRPLDSMSSVEIELSLVSQSGNPISISSSNELRLSMPLAESYGYDFGDKEITLTVNNVDYDVKQLISDGGGVGIISLPDLNGDYNSGEVYETAVISFS